MNSYVFVCEHNGTTNVSEFHGETVKEALLTWASCNPMRFPDNEIAAIEEEILTTSIVPIDGIDSCYCCVLEQVLLMHIIERKN